LTQLDFQQLYFQAALFSSEVVTSNFAFAIENQELHFEFQIRHLQTILLIGYLIFYVTAVSLAALNVYMLLLFAKCFTSNSLSSLIGLRRYHKQGSCLKSLVR
jgi:hypothetical protein